MGGAESYKVSVSCVGSPCSWHWLFNVPAPQSQKNLRHKTHEIKIKVLGFTYMKAKAIFSLIFIAATVAVV